MRMPRTLSESDIYHVIARGVSRHILFEDDNDRSRYLSSIVHCASKYGIQLFAWCLMDNHVHLLLHGPIDEVARMMRDADSTYAQYFNRRHDHVGHLFQGRFKSEAVDTDEYLMVVVCYIHQNPERAGLCKTEDYPWSSYREYVAPAGSGGLCEKSLVLGVFGSVEEFKRFHMLQDAVMPCLSSGPTLRFADEATLKAIAVQTIGERELEELGAMQRTERDARLALLREAGLSIRQIERLTGIGRNIIARACVK